VVFVIVHRLSNSVDPVDGAMYHHPLDLIFENMIGLEDSDAGLGMDLVSPMVWVLTLLLTKAIEKGGGRLGDKAADLLGKVTDKIGQKLPAESAQRLIEQPEQLMLNPVAIAEVEAVFKDSPAMVRDIQDLSAEVNRDLSLVLAIEQLMQKYQNTPTIQPIKQQIFSQLNSLKWELTHPPTPVADLHFPGGVVPLDSRFYVGLGDLQTQCEQAISQPSGLLRIQAPAQMGKTSCLERLVAYAKGLNYQVVRIDLQLVDKTALKDLDQLLQWLCRQVCKQLNRQIDVADRWNVDYGSKDNCTDFLQRYILNQSDQPLLLCIDNLERIFSYPDIFEDFLTLLRFWHDQKNEPWSRLRMVLLHVWYKETSNINGSPFNVGQVVHLPELTTLQVQDLVILYGLNWQDRQVAGLMNLVGGHPHLIRLALYEVAQGKIILQTLLDTADREDNLYGDHLRHHFLYLTQQPELKKLMAEVVHSDQPVFNPNILLRQLKDSGLIKYNGDEVEPANQLYRSYFRKRL
jgi:AAA-like domain